MDRWDKSVRQDRHGHRRANPSFSSTLLDSIYRSIDEGHGKEREEELILRREAMRKKQNSGLKEQEEEMASFRRACMIEKWMDKKVKEKVVVRRNSEADFDRKSRDTRGLMLQNSSSSSSESSSGGGFSSSESESLYAVKSGSSCYGMQRPKPIRTSVSQNPQSEKFGGGYSERSYSASTQKPKHENGFVKTKSRALKIYGDLKKVKQPISPGGRLASFLNSLFTAGNAKKAKMSSSSVGSYVETSSERKSKSTATSTCSSASSFSRSCLSKTPSSRGKFSNGGGGGGGVKRSVRFCPVSVIVDEDCRPCGQKSLHEDEPGLMAVSTIRRAVDAEIKCYVVGGDYRVEEVAKDLLFKKYQKEKQDLDMRDVLQDDNEDSEDEDDDDAASYSSSDLFELDNLSAIGIERYREELPVYETTHLDSNRAIANGLIL